MQNHLEQQVTATAAVVADLQRSIASYENQLNTANLALAKAKQESDIIRARASTGDPAATSAFNRAQDAERAADAAIAEIRLVALPKAFSQLAEAERQAENARRDLAKPHDDALKRQIVAGSARIDKLLAEVAAELELRQRLVSELQSRDDGMVSRYEDRVGLKRIYKAMPAVIRSLPANPTAEFIALAESDRQFFNLPPVETATAKAA
jgi:hypothetical protein